MTELEAATGAIANFNRHSLEISPEVGKRMPFCLVLLVLVSVADRYPFSFELVLVLLWLSSKLLSSSILC